LNYLFFQPFPIQNNYFNPRKLPAIVYFTYKPLDFLKIIF
jgi:hypothetical protein